MPIKTPVTAINMIATDIRAETVRQDLTALKTLIEMQLDKLPEQEGDYETDEQQNL